MKTCAYCTAENRNEAIFCRQCRRPLQTARTPLSAVLTWLLVVVVLIGLGSYLFSSRSFLASIPKDLPISNLTLTAGPAPTRTREPVILSACVGYTTVRVRRGPGKAYETIGGLVSDTCLTILGRNEDSSWVYVVSEDHQTGWVDASLFSDAGDLSRVSIRDDSTLANSARPTLTSAEIAHGAQAYLTKVSATNIAQAPLSRYMVPCFETADRIGDQISCRMEKAYCDYLPVVDGSSTFCTDRPYPDHTFALMVPGEDWSDYDGQCIIVSGYLEIHRGVLQMQAFRRSQVSSCD